MRSLIGWGVKVGLALVGTWAITAFTFHMGLRKNQRAWNKFSEEIDKINRYSNSPYHIMNELFIWRKS